MSITRMMILGLVRWLQPVHGYDVRREMENWHVDEWANIQPGSIYHALRKLTAEGLLEEVATERVGARPARTTYRITARGDSEFTQLLHRYWWEYHPSTHPFLAAFSFLPALTREDSVRALRNRARTLRSRSQRVDDLSQSQWFTHKPAFVRWMFELEVDLAEVEAAWCDRLASRIEAGEGVDAGSGEGDMVGRWRRVTGVEAAGAAEFGEPSSAESRSGESRSGESRSGEPRSAE